MYACYNFILQCPLLLCQLRCLINKIGGLFMIERGGIEVPRPQKPHETLCITWYLSSYLSFFLLLLFLLRLHGLYFQTPPCLSYALPASFKPLNLNYSFNNTSLFFILFIISSTAITFLSTISNNLPLPAMDISFMSNELENSPKEIDISNRM